MDSMRNDQFEAEHDGAAVARPAESAPRKPAAPNAPVREGGAAVAPSVAPRSDEVGPSRDALDVYFRHIADTELLSREEELALAKGIDAAQQGLLASLCRIPMVTESIGAWGEALREGRLRLSLIVDGIPAESVSEAADDEPQDGDGSLDAGASEMDLVPRLDVIANLGAEIAGLARKRIAALARGKELSARARKRLDELMSQATHAIAALNLQQDRIVDLVAEVEAEAQNLRETERELVRLADGHGIARAEMIERLFGRELDPDWLKVSRSRADKDWRALVKTHKDRLAELGAGFRAIAERLGLPLSDLRVALAEVSKTRRELKKLREDMVRAHLRLVVAIAKKYRGYSSLDLPDLIQEGNLGLMRAVEKYNFRHGVKVSTYAIWWIRQSITRAMADQGRMIRVPVHMTQTARKVQRERRKLHQQHGREPSAEEITARSGIAKASVEQALSLVQDPTSLDIPVGEDGDATLGDLIEATDAVDPHAAAEAAALRKCVAEALAQLSPREERILRMRFGIGMADHTLEQVGTVFGVTRERIRQIEAKALEKLGHPSRAGKLTSFTES